MLEFIQNQILFYVSLVFALFLPGYFFLRAAFGKKKKFSRLEEFVLSFGSSILIVDFSMLLFDRLKIPFTRLSLIAAIGIFSGACYAISKFFPTKPINPMISEVSFSKNQTILILLILFLTLFIKTSYLKDNILPASTDLGHHMYWAKAISQTGSIPNYEARDIVATLGNYAISQPAPISDFIIGEHLIFSAINIISGLDFISYFPVIVLHLINLMGILALFILALKLFQDFKNGKNMAILSLFFIGPLFAIAPPQAKYAGGGVIGNLIGNLLLPLIFYLFYRALKEKNGGILAMAIIFSMGLFYTHHLTGLIFLLTFAPAFLAIILTHWRDLKGIAISWIRLLFSAPVLGALAFAACFIFFIHLPSYLANQAVSTVVGGPAKIEHTGLFFSQFKFTVGEPRAAFGLVGIATLALLAASIYKKKGYGEIFLLSWTIVVMVISLKPAWVGLSIPSSRVANYTVYPLSIISAFAAINFLNWVRSRDNSFLLDKKLLIPALILLAIFSVTFGFYDNSQYMAGNTNTQKTIQTFEASRYLAEKSSSDDRILTDHIYVASDSWIKLFFMLGYNFPFYRANLSRYSNGIDKNEQCTLWMISVPQAPDADKCFTDLDIRFILVDRTDDPQFGKGKNFWQIYNNGQIKTYYRPKIN